MSSFTAVVTSHANATGLRHMLGQLRYQTRPPDETLVFCSDTPDVARLREEFPEAEILERPNMDDWGHAKRAEGLERASRRWVGFFNDDDSYHRGYIEAMLNAATIANVGAAWCDWNGKPGCGFALNESTSGNFIVRTDVAREAGYTDRVYEADGLFINKVAALTTAVKVRDGLYQHNTQ